MCVRCAACFACMSTSCLSAFGPRRTLGTPVTASWPGVEALPEYAETFPKWSAAPWPRVLPGVPPLAVDLISVCEDNVPVRVCVWA